MSACEVCGTVGEPGPAYRECEFAGWVCGICGHFAPLYGQS